MYCTNSIYYSIKGIVRLNQRPQTCPEFRWKKKLISPYFWQSLKYQYMPINYRKDINISNKNTKAQAAYCRCRCCNRIDNKLVLPQSKTGKLADKLAATTACRRNISGSGCEINT